MLFCNIGWMSRYEGHDLKPDRIVGGGKYVDDHKTGGEICNFLACSDGYVYGHVETWSGEKDHQINLERLGGTGDSVEGVDVIWTATHPVERRRRVIGWYRNATVFRDRQDFPVFPSRQHKRDDLPDYRIRALASDAHLLELEDRTLALKQGKKGWMGQSSRWMPSDKSPDDVRRFLQKTRELMDRPRIADAREPNGESPGRNSPGAAADPYVQYVQAYEAWITPMHKNLQEKFERFLENNGATEVQPDVASVDLRYRDAQRGAVLVEVKPCERASARYAIRTAIGQLLDYRQRASGDESLLIVLEVKPDEEDRLLATSNDFGIAFPVKSAFKIVWPN